MRKCRHLTLGVFIVLAFMLAACGQNGNEGSGDTVPMSQQGGDPTSAADAGLSISESKGFKAEVLSYIRVQLSWSEDSGAQGYQIDAGVGDDVFFPLATLDSSATSYEHFLAPEAAEITYRLTAVGTNDVRTVTVTTPAAVPNPVFVQATMEVAEFGFSSQGPGGFDPSTFDPATFDPSTMDPSAFLPEGFDPENMDLSQLMQPVSVSQEIGPAGGEISVTGKNGVVYTLSIPAGAISEDELFTLSPVANIEGIPFSGGFLGGVQIDPRDIEFDVPALLTFEIPQTEEPQPDTFNIAFGYGNVGEVNPGEEFYLEPILSNEDGLSGIIGHGGKLASSSAQGWSTGRYVVKVKTTGPRGATRGTAREIRTVVESTPSSTEYIRFNERLAASQTQTANASLQLDMYNNLRNMRLTDELGGTVNVSELLLSQDMADSMDSVGEFPYEETYDLLVEMTYRLLKAHKPGCGTQEEAEIMVLGGRLVNSGGGTSFRSDLRQRFIDHYGEEGKQLLDEVDKALKYCNFEISIKSEITRDERGLGLGYEIRSEVMASVYIPPAGKPFGKLFWVSPRGTGVIRLSSYRMKIQYKDFQINQENRYEICTGKMNTLEGSSLGLRFEVEFWGNTNGIARFTLTDYVLAGQQRNPKIECIDKADGHKSGGSGFSTQGGDMWGTLFFSVHRDPRELEVRMVQEEQFWEYVNEGPDRDHILGLPVTESSSIGIVHAPK
jgi:hypothetical protein